MALSDLLNAVVLGSLETELSGYALNPVSRVDILHQRDLEAGCATLTGDNSRVCKEIFPDLQDS